MKKRATLQQSLLLGRQDRAWLTGEEALLQRVELILSTPPGSVPWRPELGCRIWDMLGKPASLQQLQAARWAVEEALARWFPELAVASCTLSLVPSDTRYAPLVTGLSPLESGLIHLGVEAAVRIDLELRAATGTLRTRLELSA